MVATMLGRVSLLLALCLTHSLVIAQYQIPEVKIEVFSPKGFRASIPDAPNMGLFVFQGNVNRKIDSNELGDIGGEALVAADGWWVVDLPDVALKVGDVIKYHVFASINSAGYLLDGQEYQVTELVDYRPLSHAAPATVISTPAPPECRPTATRLRSGSACAGQTIFEENFDSLRQSHWLVEQYIPTKHPELPFVSYQKSAVTVKGGYLRITPTLQQNQPGWTQETMYNGHLNLFTGCTESAFGSCSAQSEGANIIPPIVSGRITTRTNFAFTYGTITVRAKLPKGDWLYPEILLEPLFKKYGVEAMNYRSGVVKIACARGNKILYAGDDHYGNKLLYGGLLLEDYRSDSTFECQDSFLSKNLSRNYWGDDFHIYSVNWTPDAITLLVDGAVWGSAAPAPGARGLRGSMKAACRGDDAPGMSPFDDHFYIALGVAAGGVMDFPNAIYTAHGHPKPWTNNRAKATLQFWRAMEKWYPLWEQPELLVDYVKVEAL